MSRKLRHTILAFPVTGMVLAAALIAARTVLPAQPTDADEATATTGAGEPPAAAPRAGPSVRATIAVPYFSFARGTVDRS